MLPAPLVRDTVRSMDTQLTDSTYMQMMADGALQRANALSGYVWYCDSHDSWGVACSELEASAMACHHEDFWVSVYEPEDPTDLDDLPDPCDMLAVRVEDKAITFVSGVLSHK